MTGSSASSVDWKALLPDTCRTQLLQACLLQGDSAQIAWNAFIASVGDARRFFEADHTGLKSFLPFTEFSLDANKIIADPAFRTYARVALLREELRCEIYYRVLDEVLTKVHSLDLNYCLIKGAALSPWLYPCAQIRHNHAIDIVVNRADLGSVAMAFQQLGLRAATNIVTPGQSTFLHHSELPIILHTQLLDLPKFGHLGTFAGKSTILRLQERTFSTLDITSHCLQVLGSASCSAQHGNLRWVIDAFHLIKRADEIDWRDFWRNAEQLGIQGFCAVALRYLANELGLQVADRVTATWPEPHSLGDWRDRNRFFAALHSARGSHVKALREVSNSASLAVNYLWFAVFTPADYLSSRYGITTTTQRMLWRTSRPARAIRYLLRRQTNT